MIDFEPIAESKLDVIGAEELFRKNGGIIEVRGVAYMQGRIYILEKVSNLTAVIRVYNREHMDSELETIKDDRFKEAQDIVACLSRKVLYVLSQSCILAVDKKRTITAYKDGLDEVSATISVAHKALLVTSSSGIRRYEHKLIGKPSESTVQLPRSMMTKLWHALEIDGGYILSHTEAGELNRVTCISKAERDKSYVERYTSADQFGLGSPVHLALEPTSGHIFVADNDNRRIVLLKRKSIDYECVYLIPELPERCYPTRLCYVEDRQELLVGTTNGFTIGYTIKMCVFYAIALYIYRMAQESKLLSRIIIKSY